MTQDTGRDAILGIDVGGTKIAFALGDRDGELLARHRRPTAGSGDPEQDLAAIAADARGLIEEAGSSLDRLAVCGLSLPGPIDRERGELLDPPNLPGWKAVPVRDVLERELGCPVQLENDANCAGLAEWRYGAGRGSRNLIYLTMSTGVGGGLVIGGRLHRGLLDSAGEVGHVPIEWDGELCSCGMRGCVEAYIGGAAWARRLAEVAPADGRVAELAGGPEAARPEHVVQAAGEGDAFALAEMERFNEYLARLIVQLGFVLAPEVVALGTIAVAAGEELCFRPVRAKVAARSWQAVRDGMRIVPAELGADLPYRSALCAALEGLPEG